MAREYHPDVNDSPEAQKIFADLNEAYQTLHDPKTREIYDATGMSANEQQNQEEAGGFDPFDFVFGRMRGPQPGMKSFQEKMKEYAAFFDLHDTKPNDAFKPTDVTVSIDIDFADAYAGIDKEISYARSEPCDQCKGKGHRTEADIVTCGACDGTGAKPGTQEWCDACGGKGKYPKPCVTCSG